MQRRTIILNSPVSIPSGEVSAIVTPDGAIFVQLFSFKERDHVLTPETTTANISLAEERENWQKAKEAQLAKAAEIPALEKALDRKAQQIVDRAAVEVSNLIPDEERPTINHLLGAHDHKSEAFSIIERVGECETLAELRVVGAEVGFNEDVCATAYDIKRWKEPTYRKHLLEFINEKHEAPFLETEGAYDNEEVVELYQSPEAVEDEEADDFELPKNRRIEDILNGILDETISYEKAVKRLQAIEGVNNVPDVIQKFMEDETITVMEATKLLLEAPAVPTAKRGSKLPTRKFVKVADAHTLPKGIRITAELYDGDGTVTLVGRILTPAEEANYEKEGLLDNVSDDIASAYWETDNSVSQLTEDLIKGDIEVI
jgi:hypothetical protein